MIWLTTIQQLSYYIGAVRLYHKVVNFLSPMVLTMLNVCPDDEFHSQIHNPDTYRNDEYNGYGEDFSDGMNSQIRML